MKPRRHQLSRRHRWTLFAVGLVLFASGASWAWIHASEDSESVRGALHDLKPWLLTIHGMAAAGFLLLLGTLLPTHVRHAWHARKNRRNGTLFLTAISLLTLSGYLLYYLGDEGWRTAASRLHLWLGLTVPALLFWHIRAGRRATLP